MLRFSKTTFSTARFSTARLPFGHFLENRSSFLKQVSEQVQKKNLSAQEERLLQIIKTTGSQESKDLVPVEHPGLFDELNLSGTSRYSFNIKQMMACSMHLGHAAHKWNPKMGPFIHGERHGIHVIDLEKTITCLRLACQVVTDIVANGGTVLFCGTRDNIRRLTYEVAVESGQYYVNLRWLGGTITNRGHVLRNEMTPDLLILLDYPNNLKAVEEANKMNIPVVAICDTDCDPSKITYPIPANDDAFASVELVARVLSLAANEGRARRHHQSRIVNSARTFMASTKSHIKYQPSI